MTQQTDYDVIIVGTGIAGHCAALEALMAGARVLMVDSEEKTGGSSRLSTGILMGANTRYQRSKGVTDDTPDRLYRLYMAANQWLLQPSVAKRLCYEAGPTVDWLEERGLEYIELGMSGEEDRPRGHATRGGNAIVTLLEGLVSQYDRVDTALKTRVERLVVKDGTVGGIYSGDDKVTAKSVIVAMGGMGADLDMVARWQPAAFFEAAAAPRYIGQPSSRGDAIRIAYQLDAQIVQGRGTRSPLWSFGGGYMPGYMLVVNGVGRRFYNEMSSYGMAEVQYAAQPGATGYAIFDDATKQKIKTFEDVVSHLKVLLPETEAIQRLFTTTGVDDMVAQGKITKAATLEMLAPLLGVPLDNLKGTIERYNGFVARGYDDDYFKSPKSLMTVSKGPFYAFPIHLPLYGLTATGIRIDHDACVMHRDGRAIPGLFAAGECVGGVLGSIYVGSGNSLGNCTTYGRIAGRNAAAYALNGAVPPMDWKAIGAAE